MAAIKEALVPDIGDYSDVPVIEVLVAVGDSVSKDQGLVTLESDKATMEVPAPFAGVVKELKVKVGDSLSEGKVVALIEVAEGAPTPAPAPAPAPAPVAAPAAAVASAPAATTRVEPAAPAIAREHAQPAAASPRTPPVEFGADSVLPDKVPYATQAVRLFARELGVDLFQVKGSERGGRITREDMQRYVKSVLAGGAPVAASATLAGGGGLNLLPWPKVDFSKFGEVETQPLSRIKKISGANLARNWAMIPHVTQFDQADITELEALRVQLNQEQDKARSGVKLTMLAFLLKASASALKQFPDFNASLGAAAADKRIKAAGERGDAQHQPHQHRSARHIQFIGD